MSVFRTWMYSLPMWKACPAARRVCPFCCRSMRPSTARSPSSTEEGGRARSGQTAYPGSRAQLMPGEPALFHLEGIARGAEGTVAVQGMGLHVSEIDDLAPGVDEGNGQRQRRVLHPEAVLPRLLEDKQHSMVWRKLVAKHEAARAAGIIGRHLCGDGLRADFQWDDGQAGSGGHDRARVQAQQSAKKTNRAWQPCNFESSEHCFIVFD